MVMGLLNCRQGLTRHNLQESNIWWGTALCRAIAEGS